MHVQGLMPQLGVSDRMGIHVLGVHLGAYMPCTEAGCSL